MLSTRITSHLKPRSELVAWCVVEGSSGHVAWMRCGTARHRGDGSLDVHLDALPMNGVLQIRPAGDERQSSYAPPPTPYASQYPLSAG